MRRYHKQSALTREQKAFVIRELKVLDEQAGTFSGYLSVFGNVDQGGDIVQKGAFTKTLSEAKSRAEKQGQRYLFPILWMHNDEQPLGGFTTAREDSYGLYVEGEIDLDTQLGQEKYSGLKKGYITEMSIGYAAVKKAFKDGNRLLQEVKLFEGSLIPMNGAMNPDAVVTSVKSATGKATWPIGDRDAAWDNAAATKRIETWADGDAAKLASVHFWKDPAADDTTIGAYKLLFADVDGGKVTAMPRAIFACAAAIQGSRGGVKIPDDDLPSVKNAIAGYYARMSKQFDDDSITPPWEGDKAMNRRKGATPKSKKTFAEHFAEQQCADLLEDWQDVVVAALTSAVYDAFQIGDQPESDVQEALTAFGEAVMQWVAMGQEYGLAAYLDAQGYDGGTETLMQFGSDSRPTYGWMSAGGAPEAKKGAVMSQTNHEMMGNGLKSIKAGMSILTAMHKDMAPNATSDADPDSEHRSNVAQGLDEPDDKPKTRAGATSATTHDDTDLMHHMSAFLAMARKQPLVR